MTTIKICLYLRQGCEWDDNGYEYNSGQKLRKPAMQIHVTDKNGKVTSIKGRKIE